MKRKYNKKKWANTCEWELYTVTLTNIYRYIYTKMGACFEETNEKNLFQIFLNKKIWAKNIYTFTFIAKKNGWGWKQTFEWRREKKQNSIKNEQN